jgi:phenylacetate-CoA ligase
MSKYFHKEEVLPKNELEKLQLKRLKNILTYAYENIPFYHKKFHSSGIFPADISKLEDIKKLPFTTKEEIQNLPIKEIVSKNYFEEKRIIRVHATSGTTGKPLLHLYSFEDLGTWTERMARCAYAAGLRPKHIVQYTLPFGLFTGGHGVQQGLERIGCTVIPVGPGRTKEVQIPWLKGDAGIKPNALVSLPSYALRIAEVSKNMGIDPKTFELELIFYGAELNTSEMRKRIEDEFDTKAYDCYGLTELQGPGVACECEEQDGLHIWEDHFIPEMIDPDTLENLNYGEKGELVLTSLTDKTMPLIRYRTKDITFLYEPKKCGCGRTHIRMGKITGRIDDAIRIKGVNVYPAQIESIVLNEPEIIDYQIFIKKGVIDSLQLNLQVKIPLGNKKEELEKKLRNLLGVRVILEESLYTISDEFKKTRRVVTLT